MIAIYYIARILIMSMCGYTVRHNCTSVCIMHIMGGGGGGGGGG